MSAKLPRVRSGFAPGRGVAVGCHDSIGSPFCRSRRRRFHARKHTKEGKRTLLHSAQSIKQTQNLRTQEGAIPSSTTSDARSVISGAEDDDRDHRKEGHSDDPFEHGEDVGIERHLDGIVKALGMLVEHGYG